LFGWREKNRREQIVIFKNNCYYNRLWLLTIEDNGEQIKLLCIEIIDYDFSKYAL